MFTVSVYGKCLDNQGICRCVAAIPFADGNISGANSFLCIQVISIRNTFKSVLTVKISY